MALGRSPDVAINHSASAVRIHQANHPGTHHRRESVWEIDPVEATQGRPVGLMWLSPACTHFSRARGAAPVDRRVRGLAWVGVSWAAAVQPRTIILENVAEFQTWGPLLEDGRPDPARRGETYRRWVDSLQRLGYQVEARVLDAANYGAPTTRRRLFIQARRDGQPITWPGCTHPTHVPAAAVLDWTDLGETLDERRRVLGAGTQTRVLAALEQHGSPAPNGHRAALYVYQYGGQGRRVDAPAPTLTTGDRLALVQRDEQDRVWFRSLQIRELAALMGFPEHYAFPGQRKAACHALGNAVCPPLAAALVRAALGTPAHPDTIN